MAGGKTNIKKVAVIDLTGRDNSKRPQIEGGLRKDQKLGFSEESVVGQAMKARKVSLQSAKKGMK